LLLASPFYLIAGITGTEKSAIYSKTPLLDIGPK
jgi:hypothetical protein